MYLIRLLRLRLCPHLRLSSGVSNFKSKLSSHSHLSQSIHLPTHISISHPVSSSLPSLKIERTPWLHFSWIFQSSPVQNVTWILMEIPYHSMSKIDGSLSKSTPNSMTIPCHLSRFYLFSMLKHGTDFGQVQDCHGISMAFTKTMVGFSSESISFLTKMSSKWDEKNRDTFFAGTYLLLFRAINDES